MRKFRYFLMSAAALMFLLPGCKEKNEIDEPSGVGTFKLTEIVDAAAAAYQTWEEKESFAETIKVGDKDLNTPEYQYAICKALVNISAGKKDDITVQSFKPADHPDRDSYDKETIAVVNGPKNGEDTEDLVNVATRMLARMESDLRVPNQTNFTRGGSAIAFSTERATTVISRELANYKKNGKLDAEVSASFKGAGSSIKAFAKEYVKIIDVWEKNVGKLNRLSNWELAQEGDADVVEDAHYVPNDYVINFNDKLYTTADMLETAVRSYLLLRGYDGKDIDAIGFGSFPTVAPANMNAVVPDTHEYGWNMPLIETSNGGYLYKLVNDMDTYGQVDVVILDNWAMRSVNFSFNNDMKWTNFCGYPRDPITNYKGCFSSGRALLTYAFFFKYLLDNNIDKDIDKMDDSIVIRSELFGIDTANNDKDIVLKTEGLEFDCGEGAKEANFQSKAAWTATPSADWITVEPASGDAGAITISVKVAENKGEAREGSVVIKGGNVTEGVEIAVKQAEYTAANTATIKEFAQEYVKLLDVWKNTTGTIDQMKGENYEGGSNIVENAHYIPMSTTVALGNKTYNTADMLELALRSYLLVRGYDGLDDNKAHIGAGTIPALADGAKAMSETIVPVTHAYQWGSLPYNETGTYNPSTGASSGNGGHLFKWVDGKEIHCQVDPLLLDNWAMRALNWPLDPNKGDGQISNLCGYPRDPFNNYYGAFSSMRALITYGFFFKYMLDNNLDKADGLGADVVIRSELFGDEGEPEPEAFITIADFANEYVKIIDKWEETTGDRKMHSTVAATPNAHYVPDDFTITVKDQTGKVERTYNTADMLEVALRSYLLIRGYDGLDDNKAHIGAGTIPALADGAKAMSETPVPVTHGYKWGSAPCNETSGNGGNFAMIGPEKFKVYNVANVAVLDNWAMRALNWPLNPDKGDGEISNMCTYPRDPVTNFTGSFSSMRALLTYAFFFKYMISKKYDKGTEVTADEFVRSELFGYDGQQLARWVFSAADAGKEGAYGYTFGGEPTLKDGVFNGNAYLYKPEAGDGGQYIAANWNGNGKITYVQIDKTGMEANTNAGHDVGSTGHVIVKGPWTGDYWLFTANSASELPANTKIHAKYIFRSSASGPGYFVVEYLDGSEWKPCPLQVDKGVNKKSDGTVLGDDVQFTFAEPQEITLGSDTFKYNARSRADGSSNTTVETVFNLTVPTSTVQIRARVAATNRADSGAALTKLNGGTTRISGSPVNANGVFSSPIIEIAQFAD